MLKAAIDIETTGFNAKKDKITEIAIVVFFGLEVVELFHSYVNPEVEIPKTVINLTGITNEMVKGFPNSEAVSVRVEKILKNKMLYAWNANFEQKFLRSVFGLDRYFTDLLSVYRKAKPDVESYKLNNICKTHSITHNSHSALSDAVAVYSIANILRV